MKNYHLCVCVHPYHTIRSPLPRRCRCKATEIVAGEKKIQCGQDSSPFIGLEVGASSRRDPSNRRSCSYAAGYACKRAVSVYRHVGLYTDATLDGTNDNCMATCMLNHNEHVSWPKHRVRSSSCMHRIDPCWTICQLCPCTSRIHTTPYMIILEREKRELKPRF